MMKMTKKQLKDLIFECYVDFLRRQDSLLSENNGQMIHEEGAVLPDSTDQILTKFPTLKHALVRLHTDDFGEFVSDVDWVSPKPSEFRVNLTNGQSYTLKWMGRDFEANISGKKYYLGQLVDFQKALQKLSILYKEGPTGPESGEHEDSEPEPGDGGSSYSGGGGGSFPGEEIPSEEGEEESGAEDLDQQPVDFESDENI